MKLKERHFVIFDSEINEYQYMSTVWSKEGVNKQKFWTVVSEHDTKDLARLQYEKLENKPS